MMVNGCKIIFNLILFLMISKASFGDVNFEIVVDGSLKDSYHYFVGRYSCSIKKAEYPAEYYLDYSSSSFSLAMNTDTGFNDETFSCKGEFTISFWLSVSKVQMSSSILVMEGLQIHFNHSKETIYAVCMPFSNFQ